MKKLLALGATVLLSVFLVLIEIDLEEGTSMICNEPEYEQNLGDNTTLYNEEAVTELLNTKDPITEWELLCSDYCHEWRVIRWMDYITCVETRVVPDKLKI